jgi:hypothetical protein
MAGIEQLSGLMLKGEKITYLDLKIVMGPGLEGLGGYLERNVFVSY